MMDKLLSNVNNDDLKDSLELVKTGSKKKLWNKKLMSMGLNAMKGVVNGFIVPIIVALLTDDFISLF